MGRWIGVAAAAVLLVAHGAALACQAAGAPVLDEDFKNPDVGWGKPDAIASYSGDGLVLRPPVNGSAWRWDSDFSLARADWCVDVRNPANLPPSAKQKAIGDVGVWFWDIDPQNFYTATISLDGTAAVDRLVKGVWREVVAPTRSAAIKTGAGATNEVEIVTQGDAAQFFVNGSEVASFHGAAPPGGGPPGVYGESGRRVVTWVFPRARLY